METLTGLYGFRFASPWALLALLLIPLWIWLRGQVGPVAAVQYSSAKLLEAAAHRRPKFRPSGFIILMRYSALTLLLFALARPQLETSFEDRQAVAIDLMFNLDFSSTMATRDFLQEQKRISRAEGMKAVVGEFIRARANDRIGMTCFTETARLISPLTMDHGWLLEQLAREQTAQGRALAAGLLMAGEGALAGPGPAKVVITITDAEALRGSPSPEEIASILGPLGVRCHIVHLAALPDPRKTPASAAGLANIARGTGGQYFQVQDLASLRQVHAQLDQLESSPLSVRQSQSFQELMGWFVAAAALILVAELMFTNLVWRRLP